MRKRLVFLFLVFAFWMVAMTGFRLLFMAYNSDYTRQLSISEFFTTLAYGLKMDLSVTGYVMLVLTVLVGASLFVRPALIARIANGFTVGIIILFAAIVVPDLELYRHWGFRMDSTPLFYMSREGLDSAQPHSVVLLLLIYLLTCAVLIVFWLRYLAPLPSKFPQGRPRHLVVFGLLGIALIAPIRGGFTVAAMNSGVVFYNRSKPFANHAGINVIWSFFKSFSQGGHMQYPTDYFPPEATAKLFASMMATGDSTHHVLSSARPNIIVIILESFTADIIGPLGGLPDVAPNLDAWCRRGILFSNMYATGDRTDKGLVGILSGYPAQPLTSIIKTPSKTQTLPCLPHILDSVGYSTSFLYGGDADFANMRSYLTTGGFNHITDVSDFPSELNTAKWGVRDEHLFAQALTELDTATTPFFKCILTLSSHEPFDVPRLRKGTDPNSEESLFLNACHYADSCLGNFLRESSTRAWYKNTLIVLVADHGHVYPGHKPLQSRERFRIPMLWTGGAVVRDSVKRTIASQTDIAATVLGQLQLSHKAFTFGHDLFADPRMPFAQYFFNNGYGYVDQHRYVVHDNGASEFTRREGVQDSSGFNYSRAFAQRLYDDYNHR